MTIKAFVECSSRLFSECMDKDDNFQGSRHIEGDNIGYIIGTIRNIYGEKVRILIGPETTGNRVTDKKMDIKVFADGEYVTSPDEEAYAD